MNSNIIKPNDIFSGSNIKQYYTIIPFPHLSTNILKDTIITINHKKQHYIDINYEITVCNVYTTYITINNFNIWVHQYLCQKNIHNNYMRYHNHTYNNILTIDTTNNGKIYNKNLDAILNLSNRSLPLVNLDANSICNLDFLYNVRNNANTLNYAIQFFHKDTCISESIHDTIIKIQLNLLKSTNISSGTIMKPYEMLDKENTNIYLNYKNFNLNFTQFKKGIYYSYPDYAEPYYFEY